MKTWQLKNRHIYVKNKYVEICRDDVVTFSGTDTQYTFLNGGNGVIVVPIKINQDKKFSYIMVNQYRYPVNSFSLEFPRGGLSSTNESFDDAARRELNEETGHIAEWVKLVSFINPANNMSSAKVAVFLAKVGEKTYQNLDQDELGADLSVVEVSGDELLDKIKNNDIFDGQTLAALTCVLFQSKDALKSLGFG